MLYGIRLARRIVSQAPMARGPAPELAPGPDAQTDDELIDYMHKTHNTVYHPACTAHMGPESDPLAVVDPRLRVRGIRGLRVADGSILPFLPAVNPCITTMMIGEKCADMIPADTREAPATGRTPAAGERSPAGAPSDVADFLRAHPPFDARRATIVDLVAASAEVEFHIAGTTIFSQGADPVDHVRVVRSGAVELIHDGIVLDLLGVGELFGHASMLSGLPPGFPRAPPRTRSATGSRATSRCRCWRRRRASLRGALAARAGADDAAAAAPAARPRPPARRRADSRRAGDLRPETRSARRRGDDRGAGRHPSVVTWRRLARDRDRPRPALARGRDGPSGRRAGVGRDVSARLHVEPDRLGGDVLLEMLDRGIRHFPVVSAAGEMLGVVEDLDSSRSRRAPRSSCADGSPGAQSVEELVAAARASCARS